MATLESILEANWDTDNVTTPAINTAPEYGPYMLSRMVLIRRSAKIEDYMGITTRTHYTADTHDAYIVTVASTTKADAEAMVDEIRRICAEFSPTSADKILQWDGGEWDEPTSYWHMFSFTVMKRKSCISLPNT